MRKRLLCVPGSNYSRSEVTELGATTLACPRIERPLKAQTNFVAWVGSYVFGISGSSFVPVHDREPALARTGIDQVLPLLSKALDTRSLKPNGRVVRHVTYSGHVTLSPVLGMAHFDVIGIAERNQGGATKATHHDDFCDHAHDVVRFDWLKSATYGLLKCTGYKIMHTLKRLWTGSCTALDTQSGALGSNLAVVEPDLATAMSLNQGVVQRVGPAFSRVLDCVGGALACRRRYHR